MSDWGFISPVSIVLSNHNQRIGLVIFYNSVTVNKSHEKTKINDVLLCLWALSDLPAMSAAASTLLLSTRHETLLRSHKYVVSLLKTPGQQLVTADKSSCRYRQYSLKMHFAVKQNLWDHTLQR